MELLAAPNSRSAPGGGLQFAFVQLPASAAEVALQELDGLCVYELSGSLRLKVKQSTRSLIPLLHQEQQERRQQHQQQQHGGAGGSAEAAPEVGEWGAVCEDGSVAPLQGVVRKIKKLWVAEGPPNRQVWVGNVGGQATEQSLNDVFSRQAGLPQRRLGPVPVLVMLGGRQVPPPHMATDCAQPAAVSSPDCRFGGVQRATLFQAPGYQNSYQFGIVELGSAAEAEAARSALQGATGEPICDGKPLKVRYCWPRSRLRRLDAGSSGGGAASTGAAASQQQPGPGALCCAACGAAEPQVALKLCSGCHATRYCSCECQLASWEAQHHAECGRLAQLGGLLGAQPPQVPPELTKLLLAALQQPLSRQGQLVRALVAHQPTAAAAT